MPSREEIEQGKVRDLDDKDNFLEPTLAFLPDGYVEPLGTIELNYKNYEISYSYNWDSEDLRIIMEKQKQ